MEQQFDNLIDAAMYYMTENNHDSIENALITKIPNTNVYYNSVNIAVGKQGSGKT